MDYKSFKPNWRGLLFSKKRYVITFLAVLVWVIFFDRTNLIDWYGEWRNTKKMEKEKLFYQTEIKAIDEKLYELSSNDNSLEKFAREQYYMKRPNEDIFLVEE